MENLTASAVISFIECLEDSSSDFYKRLAERFKESEQKFLAFAVSCKKTKMLVIRTYQETVSDALETGFSFEGLSLKDYDVDTALSEGICYSESLKIAIALEEKAGRFYLDVAKRAQSLLATIPRAFNRAAEEKIKRRIELQLEFDKIKH